MSWLRLALTSSVACLCFAQTFNGRITGTVRDSQGAVVPLAAVSAKQLETNVTRSAKTASSGVFDIPLLLSGHYEVTVSAPGLETQVRRDVPLEVNQTVTLDFRLNVASIATAVDVTAEVPLLQAESSGAGTTIEQKVVESFPLVERDVMGLVRAIPGVVAAGGVGGARGSRNVFDSNFSSGGGRTSMNEVLLDGSANTIGDFNGVVVVPPQDSVQEFRVETSTYSAEFGRSGGAAVNIVTKGGGNRYHGSLYYFAQNDAFNANVWTNNRFGIARSVLRRHNYGYSLGGPIEIPKLYKGRNKTFFFSTWEGRRDKTPLDSVYSVPTAAERAGDFSKTVNLISGQPQLITIYDPQSSVVANGARSRTAFAGNIIPASRINAISQAVEKYYPDPNRAGSSVTGRQNYNFHASLDYSRDVIGERVDHYFSANHRLFLRTSFQESLEQSPTKVVLFRAANSTWDHFKNYALDDTYQISTHLNNVFRYSYTRFRANLISNTMGFDPTALGLPAYFRDSANVLFFPNFTLNSPFPDLGGTAYNNQPRDTQGFQDNVVYTRGRHNIKAGAEYRLYRFYPFQVFNPTGGFSFSAAFTQNDQLAGGSPSQGFGYASFLLGTGNFSFDHVEALSGYHHYADAYYQDDWKITSRLTLNLGARWEVETGTKETHGRISYFDPNAVNPAGGKGAMVFPGNGNPDSMRVTNWANFGPRLGFAYRPFDKWVVRGGWGIFYLPLGLEPTLTTTPFNYTLTADVLNSDYTPKTTLSNPFPAGLPKPNAANPANDGSYRLGSNVNIVLRDQPAEYLQEWNFAIERQLARTTVMSITYTGSRGVHLPIPSLELNQIDPINLAKGGSYLTTLVPNPYYGKIASGLLSLKNIPQEQLLKPFPTFAAASTADAFGGSLAYFRPPVGDSVYHAMTVKFERRYTRGLSVTAHYTWSKLLDTGGVGNGNAFNDPSALRDIYNVRLERSLGSFDVPHRIIATFALELPFGRSNKMFGHSLWKGPAWLDRVIGGWELLGFETLQSSRPVNVGGPDLSRIAGASPSRASVVYGQTAALPYDVSVANARDYDPRCGCTKPWFNPAAFSTTPQFVIPNGPRFLPDVRGGFTRNLDVTMSKKIRLREKWMMAVEGRFYNVLNQVTFAGPSVITVNSANFGSAGGVSSDPRRIDVGGKMTW